MYRGFVSTEASRGQSFTLPVAWFGDAAIDIAADWYEAI